MTTLWLHLHNASQHNPSQIAIITIETITNSHRHNTNHRKQLAG